MVRKTKEIVRMFGTDLSTHKSVKNSLRKIKGIKFSLVNSICKKAGIDPDQKIEDVPEKKLEQMEKILEKSDIPDFLKNSRKDPEGDRHLIAGKLEIKKREDINFLKKLGSYRGIRHRIGLPVRGQKTKSSFRGKRTLGVSKKAQKK